MRLIKKRLIAILITLVIFLGNISTVSAVGFPDIPKSSFAYDAAEYLREESIMFGSSNGYFYPLEKITGDDFGTVVYRLLYPGESLAASGNSESDTYLDYLYQEEVITGAEFKMLTKDSVTWQIIWRVLLPHFGVYPYPNELYPEYDEILICDNIYADMQVAAIEVGLADVSTICNVVPSRGDFAVFLYRLMAGKYTPLGEKDFPSIPDELLQYGDNWQARNAVIRAYDNLPARLTTRFLDSGWELCYDGLHEEFPEHENAVGMTDFSNRKIYLDTNVSEETVYHEFGHFLEYTLGIRDKSNDCYLTESSHAEELLGDYAMTDFKEYFAEAYAYWIDPDNDRTKLKEVAPETAALLETYVN